MLNMAQIHYIKDLYENENLTTLRRVVLARQPNRTSSHCKGTFAD